MFKTHLLQAQEWSIPTHTKSSRRPGCTDKELSTKLKAAYKRWEQEQGT